MNRPGGQIITNPITSVDLDRDIGNFFYDLKPTRDAGVGLTEQTIDYIVDVKGEPDWIREFRKNAYRVFNPSFSTHGENALFFGLNRPRSRFNKGRGVPKWL